jgi:hypothetical protein
VKKGFELGGKYSQDPIGSQGKSLSQRKHRLDGPSWTPTESRQREQLMKQFCKLEGQSGNSSAYINSPVWCPGCNGKRLRAVARGLCERCEFRALADDYFRSEGK